MLEPHEECAQREWRYLGGFCLEPPEPPSVNPQGRRGAAGDALGEEERLRCVREGVSVGFFRGF